MTDVALAVEIRGEKVGCCIRKLSYNIVKQYLNEDNQVQSKLLDCIA